MSGRRRPVLVRPTRTEDFPGIVELTARVYPGSPPWTPEQLASHLRVFPEGQLVACDRETGQVIGMAASLIVRWDDYQVDGSWRDFTAGGFFTNHDPVGGRTLYGAEVMTAADRRGTGIGGALYRARRELVEGLGLLRIRAGARLRGYNRHASDLTPEQYVIRVIRGEIRGPTLGFQLRHGFRVLAVVPGYLRHDPESLGYAALIEWINPRLARAEDYAGQDPRFTVG